MANLFGIRSCKLCGIVGEDDLFQKSSDRKSGRKNICKKCINYKSVTKKSDIDFQSYLKEHKNGYFLKKCIVHGALDYEQIILAYRKTRLKYYLTLLCSHCELINKQNAYNNERRIIRINEGSDLKCSSCLKVLPINKFNDSELKSRSLRCKKCKQKIHNKYKYNTSMSNKFQFTGYEFDEMLKKQNYVCKICKCPETAITKEGKIRNLSVDHCHGSESKGIMKIRGLLCHGCNHGLGCFRDNPKYLRKAAIYLEEKV